MDNDVLLCDIIEYCIGTKVKLLSLNSFECGLDEGLHFLSDFTIFLSFL